MKKYLIEFDLPRAIKPNGNSGKKRGGSVIINASSELAAKHKFYQTHSSTKGYSITSIDEVVAKGE